MNVPLLPPTRVAEHYELTPCVHWAQIQQAFYSPGTARRIVDFELVYIIRGDIQVHFECEDDPVRSGAGDLFLLPPATTHRIEVLTESNTQLLGIHFDFFNDIQVLAEQDLVVKDLRPQPEQFCRQPVNPDGTPLFQRFYGGLPPEPLQWMERLIGEFGTAQPGYAMACRGLLLQLLAVLLRLHDKPIRNLHPEYRAAVQQLVAEMEASLEHPWTNAAMAQQFGVSEDHFIRIFRDIVGMSPHKYLQSSRHLEAKRLLRETSQPIEMIGRGLGYEDLPNFSKSFKKWQGVSPREYRRLSILY